LIQNDVLRGSEVTKAFRLTDRGDFVPQIYRSEQFSWKTLFLLSRYLIQCKLTLAKFLFSSISCRNEAYFDRPFKRDYVHISAPHMYGVGSGSGYLSCLAATLLGDGGVSHGIDMNPAVVRHSKECCQRWYSSLLESRSAGDDNLPVISPEGVQFVVGNCFDIEIK
jgi:protein-L-isoaspartate O-methyltransferase